MYLKLLRCFVIAIYFVITATNTQGAVVPRLWEVKARSVEGKTETFHILGVSHNGMDVEYDAYLNHKVLPIFNRATVYSYERNKIDWRAIPECPKPLSESDERASVQAARDKLVAGYLLRDKIGTEYFPPKTDAEFAEMQQTHTLQYGKNVAQASELALLYLTKENTQSIAGIRRIRAATARGEYPESFHPRPQISQYLKQRRPRLRVASIDTDAELVSAYCGLEIPVRGMLFRAWLAVYDHDKEHLPVDPGGQANVDFVNSIRERKAIGEAGADISMPGFEQSFVCVRNQNWMQKIVRDQGQGQRFYALGLGHLLSNSTCPDLLTMLHRAGMTVKLIK